LYHLNGRDRNEYIMRRTDDYTDAVERHQTPELHLTAADLVELGFGENNLIRRTYEQRERDLHSIVFTISRRISAELRAAEGRQ